MKRKNKSLHQRRRAENRAERRRLAAHLILHGFFPVTYNSIAQSGGRYVYLAFTGHVAERATHSHQECGASWPLLPTLRVLARHVGKLP